MSKPIPIYNFVFYLFGKVGLIISFFFGALSFKNGKHKKEKNKGKIMNEFSNDFQQVELT
jgi:hypothetical protein